MKKNLLMLCAAAGTLAAGATDAPADYKNVLGAGADHATLTVTWGDNHSIDNLASAVRFDGTATVASVIAEALKADPRFYALAGADGSYVAYGFDTDGDYSAAVTIGEDKPELTDGVATAAEGADLSAAAGSALYDHWCVSGDTASWTVYVNGAEAAMTDEVSDGDAVRLIYGNAEDGEKFYLRPATERGAWMMPSITFDTANGKQQSFPFIANVINRDDLYSSYINFDVTDKDGNKVTTMSTYANYRNAKDGTNMSVRLTANAQGDVVITPYVQTGIYKNEIHYHGDIPSEVSMVVAHPVTGIAMKDWPAAEGETANITLYDVINFRASALPEDADFGTVIYSIDDPEAAEIYAQSRYDFDMFISHKTGDFVMTASVPGTDIGQEYRIHVSDRDRTKPANYTDGTFWLSEEWFGHTNGSINYIKPDYSYILRAYEQVNPTEGFGATSQFGMIYADKLFITSKQQKDGGDPRPGGGRLVVADAYTLEKLASFDFLGGEKDKTSADGRGMVGVNPHKVYVGSNSRIGVLNLDDMTYDPDGLTGMPTDGSIYSKQYGDMVCDGRYVYVARQSTGLVVIDAEADKYVTTIPNTNIQGVARTADGRVWMVDYSKNVSTIYNIDPETLEVAEQYQLPAGVSCSWGSWRSTKFVAAKRSNKLIWNNNYVWDMDADATPENVTPVLTSSDDRWPLTLNDQKQGVYGSVAYDDRSGLILWSGNQGYGTDGRFTWYNFTDANNGDTRTVRVLPDYYFFPAIPIVPDKHLPALVNPDMRVEMLVDAEEPVEVDLHEAIDDMDGANKFIRFALVSEPQAAAEEESTEPVAAEIKDGKLLLTPQKIGDTTVKLTAESNGREALISIPVYVADKGSSIGDTAIDMDGKMFDLQGNVLTFSGYEGVTVGIYDINGRQVIRFTPDSSYYTIALDLASGVYAMGTDGCHRFKFMLK